MRFIVNLFFFAVIFALNCNGGIGFTHSHSFFRSRPNIMGLKASKENYPIALVVTVEIDRDRVEDFLEVIEADAIGSRTKENGGCLRFDVLKDKESDNKFTFYETYKDQAAVDFHKATPHFKLWSDFKATGAVLSQSVIKADAIFYSD
mmetsp:Transcript_16187/g.28589  ORF Transcript_16187/g.28589 Transcript_16187/m.28589 type:complete len:148 (-) Transcript_16187:240-683(-)